MVGAAEKMEKLRILVITLQTIRIMQYCEEIKKIFSYYREDIINDKENENIICSSIYKFRFK